LIVPDLRGFGASTHPGDVKSSGALSDLVGDLVCILQQANVKSVTCMGYDFSTFPSVGFSDSDLHYTHLVTTGVHRSATKQLDHDPILSMQLLVL
jgi:hypothetical protein